MGAFKRSQGLSFQGKSAQIPVSCRHSHGNHQPRAGYSQPQGSLLANRRSLGGCPGATCIWGQDQHQSFFPHGGMYLPSGSPWSLYPLRPHPLSCPCVGEDLVKCSAVLCLGPGPGKPAHSLSTSPIWRWLSVGVSERTFQSLSQPMGTPPSTGTQDAD